MPIIWDKLISFIHHEIEILTWTHCTEVRFASLLSSRFSTMAVINPPEKKLANRTSVQWFADLALGHFKLLLKS